MDVEVQATKQEAGQEAGQGAEQTAEAILTAELESLAKLNNGLCRYIGAVRGVGQGAGRVHSYHARLETVRRAGTEGIETACRQQRDSLAQQRRELEARVMEAQVAYCLQMNGLVTQVLS